MAKLAADGKQQGWWQPYANLPDDFRPYVGLEEDATAIRTYQSTTVPGLLQTAEYVRQMSNVLVPEVSAETADELVEVKQRRQGRLSAVSPLPLSVVLDEAVLHRVVGGPGVMGAQLERMIEATRIHSVTIQVIPYIAGAHPAMDSTFTILDFADRVPSVVYVEGLVGWIYLERPQDITRYEYVFERLKASALSPRESTDLIAEVAKNYRRAAADAIGTPVDQKLVLVLSNQSVFSIRVWSTAEQCPSRRLTLSHPGGGRRSAAWPTATASKSAR